MFLKIYFGDKPLFLCNAIEPVIEPYLHHDDAVFIDELNSHTVKSMIHEMQLDKVHAGVFLHPDLDALKKVFFRKFTLVQAGGGLVLSEADESLLIFRRGKWDLPKGKLDKGETLEECAVREVEEETGLKNVVIEAPLLVTWHTYHEGTRFILKESHWYRMRSKGDLETAPQAEEDITGIRWVTNADLPGYFNQSFPSVVDVLKTRLAK